MIEVKSIGPLTIRRPFHYVCAGTIAGTALLCAGGFTSSAPMAAAGLAVCGAGYAALSFRYQRRRPRLSTLPAILALPFVYFGALLRGSARFGSYGALR